MALMSFTTFTIVAKYTDEVVAIALLTNLRVEECNYWNVNHYCMHGHCL